MGASACRDGNGDRARASIATITRIAVGAAAPSVRSIGSAARDAAVVVVVGRIVALHAPQARRIDHRRRPVVDVRVAVELLRLRRIGVRRRIRLRELTRARIHEARAHVIEARRFLALAGDPERIRNAGGRATDDAIRSLVISTKLLGTREWFVIHHTNCGMETFTDQVMGDLLAKSLDTAQLGEAGWTQSTAADLRRFLVQQMESHGERRLITAPMLEGLTG